MPLKSCFAKRFGIALLIFSIPIFTFGQSRPSTLATPPQHGSTLIRWEGKSKISRYRLQLARNEQFTDIVYDKVVQGLEHKVTDIPPGNYFWRVAPAASEAGSYSNPVAIVVADESSPNTTKVETKTLLSPANDIGWRAATGVIDQPVAAKLRDGPGYDVLGVNAYGMVYALDGQTGIASWSARYRPGAKKGEPVNSDGAPAFAPVLLEGKDNSTNVLVAFDGGVRALEGKTGREVWRAALPGNAMVGLALNSDQSGSGIAAVFDNSHSLTFLKNDSGQIVSQTKIDGLLVGIPAALTVKNERAIILALDNGMLDVRNLAGISIMAIKLDAAITTNPLIVKSPRGRLVMLGTDAGLVALDASDLTPLWRVATSPDAPTGVLTSSDLESNGTEEVVMITRNRRVVAIDIAIGKIRWVAESGTDAMKVSFADLNGDATKDIIVAGGSAFALGYSGKDGALIWKADEGAPSSTANVDTASPRILITVPSGADGSALLIGTDAGRSGLRAVGLPAGSLK